MGKKSDLGKHDKSVLKAMGMKKNIKIILNIILNRFGFQTIPMYELKYINEKHQEAVNEYVCYLRETIFKDIKEDLQRNKLLTKLYGTTVGEAMYIIDCLNKTSDITGEVCEFGVANGSTSVLIANEIKSTNKKLWLYDSFQGLSKPTKEDVLINDIFNLGAMVNYESTMSYPDSYVRSKLTSINFPKRRTRIITGFIDKTIYLSLPKKVAFAYIDFDLYEPTMITLDRLDRVLSKGSFVVVDDYDYFSSGVKIAVDKFVKKHRKYKLIMPKKFAGKFCILHKFK